jgi:hypothetical protein
VVEDQQVPLGEAGRKLRVAAVAFCDNQLPQLHIIDRVGLDSFATLLDMLEGATASQ